MRANMHSLRKKKKAGIFAKRKSQRIKIDGKIYIRRNKSLKTIKTTLWWMWSQRRERALVFVHPQFHSINLRDVLLPNIMPRTQIYGIFFRSWFIAHFSFSLPYKFTFWLFSDFFVVHFIWYVIPLWKKFMWARAPQINRYMQMMLFYLWILFKVQLSAKRFE